MTSWIKSLEAYLKLDLPQNIVTLYADSDGDVEKNSGIMRLLPCSEVIEMHKAISQHHQLYDSCPLWEGSNGEYAAIYLAGPLSGRIYFWNYDGRHDSIAYRNIQSFQKMMEWAVTHKSNWYSIATDYYVDTSYYLHGEGIPLEPSTDCVASDIVAKEQLSLWYSQNNKSDEDEVHYAFNTMSLTPISNTQEVLPFLKSDDMWIQERACRILGNRKLDWAIEHLAQVVEKGQGNGVGAALWSLGNIGGADAKRAILESSKALGKGDEIYVKKALAKCEESM